MALAGFSKSLIAAAASLLVALTGFAAVAATSGFAVKEEILGKDASGNTTTTQTKSLAPKASTTITVTVSRTSPDQTRPGLLTLNFTLPAGVDFVSVTGCTLPKGFDPSAAQPTCTVNDPFAFSTTKNAFGTSLKATIAVARHFDSSAPVPTSCPTANLGDVTVEAVTDVGDDVIAAPAVTIGVKPYADIDVTATAPATANLGATIPVVGTIKNLGPCDATTVQIDPQTSSAAGVSLLTFASISGACTVTVSVNPTTGAQTPTPGKDGSCVIADLAPGASATITKTYTVNNVNVNGQDQTMRTSGYASAGADQADPNSDNDVGGTATLVPNSSGGCSTGGAIGPMALLGLMLVLSRKRRTA
jgi:uncharacterized protein DUF11